MNNAHGRAFSYVAIQCTKIKRMRIVKPFGACAGFHKHLWVPELLGTIEGGTH